METFRFDSLQDPEHREHHFDRTIEERDLEKFDPVSRGILGTFQELRFSAVAELEMVAAISVSIATKAYTHYFHGGSEYFTEAEPGMLVVGEHYLTLWLLDRKSRRGRYPITSIFHQNTIPLIEKGNLRMLREMVKEQVDRNIQRIVESKEEALAAALAEATTLQAEIAAFTGSAKWDPLIPWPD